MKAKRLFFLVMAICLASGVRAQFYDDDVYFYARAGESISDKKTVLIIVHFNGHHMFKFGNSVERIQNNLRKSPTYYDEYMKSQSHDRYKYSSEYSNSQKVTYVWPQRRVSTFMANYVYGNEYWTFDKDKSKVINWEEKYDSDEITHKYYYINVPKEDLMPKAANHDFLYE